MLFFETVSDFTTTGASILTNLDNISHASLFWHSFTHWVGGMGVLVFTVAFIPLDSNRTLHILKAEMPGPIVGKLVSKVRVSARILYMSYAVLTVIEIILLLLGGMPLFDSVLNSFATAGTGGFSMTNAGIGLYNSPYIEGIIAFFMILFGIDFNLVYFFLIGKILSILKSEELNDRCLGNSRDYDKYFPVYHSYLAAFRYTVFQVASIIITTGFATANYDLWPMSSQTILLLLMFTGACSSSTDGEF